MTELKRPTPGTVFGLIGAVMGFAALIVSLSGIATAGPTKDLVRKGEIAPGAVTAKALAKSAVTSKALAKGAVSKRKLAKGSVTANAIASSAVTRSAIAPGSVYGAALGEQTIHVTPVADLDAVAANPDWTAGNSEAALCGVGERLMSVGFGISQPGNREVTWLQVKPFVSPESNGVSGLMASNAGGTAKGEIIALCLK